MVKMKLTEGCSRRVVALLLLLVEVCGSAIGRDAFVMLSGGDSPFDNNFSQYLQARAVVTYFQRNYPQDSVWLFFGAGNIEGQKPVFGDVHRQVKQNGIVVDSWLAGSLPRNRPARRDVVLRAFREEILPAVAEGGTLYLFVGDHGSRTDDKHAESIIALWSLERDSESEHGWRFDEDESLGVAELRRTLAKGIGKGRMVFCMTQCHAGGFHYLAMPHQVTPNPKWFNIVPDWATPSKAPMFAPAAGFTATDEFSPASGCDPDPDPEKWAGYERFIPENLLGVDLFTMAHTGKGLRSFAEAHVAATLEDQTIDKPCSTSDQYLERWANLIETRLRKEPNLAEKIRKPLAAYERSVNGTTPQVSDAAFRERQDLFRRFTKKMAEQNAMFGDLLLNGTREELETAINPDRGRNEGQDQGQPQRQGRRGSGASSEKRKLWKETVRPAWKAAVEAGLVTNLPGAALEFEKHLLQQEDKGRNYFFGGASSLQKEIFWESGYSDPQTVNLAKADAVARWGVERRRTILAWSKTANDEDVRSAAGKLSPARSRRQSSGVIKPADTFTPLLSEKTAAERTLFYRRVLAAWQFLLAINERPALARLRELTDLERTPLPRPGQ
jgi:hypothetical protein